MRKVYVTLISFGIIFLSVNMLQAKMLIRIHNYPQAELHRGLDIVGAKRGEWIDVAIDEKDLPNFEHLKTEILIEDLESFYSVRKGEYHYYSEFVDSLETIAANHSDIVILDTLGTTYEGREILVLKISENVALDEDEPELLFIGLHHAREWPSLEICLFYVDTLTRGYGTDPNITQIVDSREIWIVPCMNPDGYVWCHDEGHDWRKNRRYFSEFGTYGVDLNRNYDGANNGDPLGEWGSIPGATSHGAHTEVYCGPSPFSEAETKAVRDLILAHDFIFGVSYHTYGEMVMWQWGYTSSRTDDSTVLSDIGEEMASRVTTQSGVGTYDAYQSAGLYPTSGDFGDWSYGFSLYTGGKNLLAYTVEACSTFHPPASDLDQIVRENFDGAFYLCEIADSIADLLTPRVMPPELAELDTSYTGSYTVAWSQKNPAASPNYYQLDELSGFSALTDDAESGDTLWIVDHFTINTSRHHSPDHSYYSNLSSGNDVASLTTRWPLLVSTQDSLSFWCWYDIEENWDYAYVEVSLDGRKWDILDEFTGSSGWVKKVYPLDTYTGRSIFLRFRYITDGYIENEGLWVDDIYPVADFNKSTTLDSMIHDTTYTIDWREPGQYWYRVRGHNDPRGWGDWSQLQDIVTTSISEEETRPVSPNIYFLQNIPNPFHSNTLINFYVPDRCGVSLDIYNLLGEHIANLKKDRVGKGQHSVSWSSSLAPGVYFCRLESRFGIRTIKLIRLK